MNNESSSETTEQKADENPSEQFAELLKNFIPPSDVILGIPLEFKYKGKTLKIHGRASYFLRMIDKDIEALRAIYGNQPSPPEAAPNVDKEKAAYEKAIKEFHKKREARSEKIYDLIDEILFKILNEDWEKPTCSKEWIAKNIPITLGDYIPPADAPLGLPSAWFSEEDQEQFPIALRILNAYPLRQNPNHLLKNAMRARMF
ncbi:hypothetical protein IH992_22330 [Candidatus Poribacteria bacterium]|nr:hypothetical protein [Candidatus Poribacteria bacterium]